MFTNSEQKLNDQKLEFVSYKSSLSMGLEKIITGNADRIYHGGGPIIINFKETPALVTFIIYISLESFR